MATGAMSCPFGRPRTLAQVAEACWPGSITASAAMPASRRVGGMAVFHLVGDLNGLVGKSPQLFVRNAGKGILDVPTQALLGLVWRGECLSLPKVLPGVIHGPAKCL